MAADGIFWYNQQLYIRLMCFSTLDVFFVFCFSLCGWLLWSHFFSRWGSTRRVGQVQSFKNNYWPSAIFKYVIICKTWWHMLGGEPAVLILSGSAQQCRFLRVSVCRTELQPAGDPSVKIPTHHCNWSRMTFFCSLEGGWSLCLFTSRLALHQKQQILS